MYPAKERARRQTGRARAASWARSEDTACYARGLSMADSTFQRLGRLLATHRRRIATVVALGAVLGVGSSLFDAMPREVHLRYRLGPSHGEVTELRLVYAEEGGEAWSGADLAFPGGAPEDVDHRVRLPPGRYRIEASLSGPGGSRQVWRPLAVPAEGRVEIELFDLAYAMGGPR